MGGGGLCDGGNGSGVGDGRSWSVRVLNVMKRVAERTEYVLRRMELAGHSRGKLPVSSSFTFGATVMGD